jgi:adenylate cyclase 10
LFLVLEDCNLFDAFSIEFLKLLLNENAVKNISLIYTHQDKLFYHIEDKENKFIRCPQFFNEDSVEVFYMNNIINHEEVSKLIKFAVLKSHFKEDKIAVSRIEGTLIDIIISKSLKGNPFFIFEITESLLNSKKLIQHLSTEILVTSELLEMEEFKNWCEFQIPIVIEKLVGSVIDSLNIKEIILMKIASIIGNIFDINTLLEINEFSNLSLEELYLLLKNLENNGILEFLFDRGHKNLVCKFAIPFFREILYQRMLIEQKNELHLKVARTLQNPMLRYYSHEMEVKILNMHLRNSERTILVQMEEDDSIEETYQRLYRNNMDGGNNLNKYALRGNDSDTLNITNLKIFLVKDIVQKIKKIENSINIPIEKNKTAWNEKFLNKSLQQIISGFIYKKSDQKFTWEKYLIIL